MSKLALLGGEKIRNKKFPAYNVIGEEEKLAVLNVFDSNVFSRFLGCWHENFYGGPQVQKLEQEWSEYFNVKHAISVNSATSALYCAIGAIGIGPGDEVIVPPYTMSATAVAPLVYNAIPIFADIEEDCFCLSPESIEKNITSRTKAIIVVDILGQPYDCEKINAIAKKYNLKVIEDCAQAPGAKYKDQFAGTLGDIGIFSLNYHKHIHSGEGGIIVTNDDELADKLRLIRNHAEAVIPDKGFSSLVNMIGFNYRMTEIEAAIASEQLKKLDFLTKKRIENVNYLSEKLEQLPFIELAKTRNKCRHVFYVHSMKFKKEIARIHRDTFLKAVAAELEVTELREAEGVCISTGVKPLYLQPLYQNKIAYGENGCPWSCEKYNGNVSYEKGICPITEKMHEEELIIHELIHPNMSKQDLDDVANAFWKVWENRVDLYD